MASVRLTAGQELPPVCARCGRPADGHVARTFSWHPPWVAAFVLLGVLPGVILMFYLTRKQKVRLPMCARHLGHWKDPSKFALVGLILSAAFILLGATVVNSKDLTVAGVVLFFANVAVAAVWTSRLIRSERVGRHDLVLTGVSDGFAQEAKKLRDGPPPAPAYDEYDDDEYRRRPNRYDIDVDEE